MRTTPLFAALLTTLAHAAVASAQAAPVCAPHESAVFAPGCDGPPRLVCDGGASLPAGSSWCGCDGHTAQSWSMAPPAGVRYRFQGACEVQTRFVVTDERAAHGARTGRVVVFLEVGSGSSEVTRIAGPCRDAPTRPGELARMQCGPRGTDVVIAQTGDDVVAREGEREVGRIATPHGQRVSGGAIARP